MASTAQQPTSGQRLTLKPRTIWTIFAVTVVLAVVFDRLTKIWAETSIPSGGLDFIPGVIGFRLVFNKGMSFSLLEGATVLFLVVTLAICAAIVVYLVRYRKHVAWEVASLGLVFAGAIGNATDRIATGQVTDFLNFEFVDFAVFNVADSCITIGVVLFLVYLVFNRNSPMASERKQQEKVDSDGQ